MIFKSPLQILNRGSMKMEPGMFINNVQNNIRTLTMIVLFYKISHDELKIYLSNK